MKVLVGTFNQEKALVGAFSVIVKTGSRTDGSFYSTIIAATEPVPVYRVHKYAEYVPEISGGDGLDI